MYFSILTLISLPLLAFVSPIATADTTSLPPYAVPTSTWELTEKSIPITRKWTSSALSDEAQIDVTETRAEMNGRNQSTTFQVEGTSLIGILAYMYLIEDVMFGRNSGAMPTPINVH